MPRHPRPFTQATELQQIMASLTRNCEDKASVRAQCARVWCLLEDCKRVIAMRPLPKSVDVDKWRASRRKGKHANTDALPADFKPKESL